MLPPRGDGVNIYLPIQLLKNLNNLEVTMQPIVIGGLELYSELNETGAEYYYKAMRRKDFLDREVVKKFEKNLKAYPGFSDENIPGEPVTEVCELGDARFHLKTSPTTKRPGYGDVFSYAQEYLAELLRNFQDGTRVAGLITLDGKPYVSAGLVLGKIEGKREEVLERGCKVEVTEKEVPEALKAEETHVLAVPLGNGLGELTPGNAVLYLRALDLLEGYQAIIDGFEGNLKALTGYGKENIPKEPQHLWHQIGRHLFHVPSTPFQSPSYGKMVDRLAKRAKKPKSTGELVLIEQGLAEGLGAKKLESYSPRARDGKHFVSVQGLLDRMGKIKEENTKRNLKQRPINHYPIV